MENTQRRIDHLIILGIVQENAKVLDIGCGDGELLQLLSLEKHIKGHGIELSQRGVNSSVSKGLMVIQGDADTDLLDYPDKAFDCVILSQTLQATQKPKWVIQQMLRISDLVIISFPNFGYWKIRASLLFRGKMPKSSLLPFSWYDTPNIHLCTIKDFLETIEEVNATIETSVALNANGKRLSQLLPWRLWNFFGEQAIFSLRRRQS